MKKENKCLLKKRKSRAFGKDVFLLGENEEGQYLWLESPKWDCDWYWGFGYIEIYNRGRHINPENATDTISHSHFSGLVGEQEKYDIEKRAFVKGEYIRNVYDSPELEKTVFDIETGWKLSELFRQFYLLREMSDFCHKEKPGCHIMDSPVDHGNMGDWYYKINNEMIPRITAEIIRILSPEVK